MSICQTLTKFFKIQPSIANQIYHSWAYRNNVNLFAAGTNFAPATSTGSGFFLGRSGSAFSVFTQEPLRDFYAMKIPKAQGLKVKFESIPEKPVNRFANLNFGRDLIDDFETKLIDLKAVGSVKSELCQNNLCCSFVINFQPITSTLTFQYRFIAFNGHRTYSGWGDKKLIICGIMLCNDDKIDSCGKMPDYSLNRVTFDQIEVSTTFSRFGVLMMPNSLNFDMDPLHVDDFNYNETVTSENLKISTIKLQQPRSDIQAFALYGHDFEIDDEFDFDSSDDESGTDSLKAQSLTMVFLIANLFFNVSTLYFSHL